MTMKWALVPLAGIAPMLEPVVRAQERDSLAGEAAARALKEAAEAEAGRYNIRVGPVGLQTGARLRLGYTDNLFYTEKNREDDFLINPQVDLTAFMRVSELNTVKLSVGVGYELYTQNDVLDSDAPLVNPDSELAFNLFVGDFRFRFHERFYYQETLFFNSSPGREDLYYNFNNVGRFSRWDNRVGFDVDWDLNKYLLSAGFDHENFNSSTSEFEYLTRSSEWFRASAAVRLGDQVQAGLEGQASLHDFDTEEVLNDNWRARVGPFVEARPIEKITLRAGVGFDTAQYDQGAADSDYETYYAYGQVSQETRFFRHALSGGRETLLGDNANNLETTYLRYSITSPIIEHVTLGGNAAVHFAEEFGGSFREDYTYYVFGARVGYQFHKYWRADLAYEFILKESDLALRDYYRNRVTLGISFTF
jgi:hypothetical protein